MIDLLKGATILEVVKIKDGYRLKVVTFNGQMIYLEVKVLNISSE